MHEAFRINRSCWAARHEEGGDRAGIAERPFGYRCAEPVKEGVADIEAVENALGAEIAVGQYRGRAGLVDDRRPSRLDLAQRFIPTGAAKRA
jgi:hypothetical protein